MNSASSAGRKARRSGSDAEVLVLRAAERYAALGQAWLWRCGRRGRFERRGDSGSPVDFVGYLHGGRALLVEVKSTSAKRLGLHPHGKPLITEPESLALNGALSAGAVALVVARTADGWWSIEWDLWEDDGTSHSAMKLDRIGYRVPVVDGLPMFLHWMEDNR